MWGGLRRWQFNVPLSMMRYILDVAQVEKITDRDWL